jgi:ABC-type branched-subunit amino acid transport system ATPase component
VRHDDLQVGEVRGDFLENGRIAGEGPARQLLEDPAVQSAYLGMSGATA